MVPQPVGAVGHRRAAPERQRLRPARRRLVEVLPCRRGGREFVKPVQIHLFTGDFQDIATRHPAELHARQGTQLAAQSFDVAVQSALGLRGIAPNPLHEGAGGHRVVRVDSECRQHTALLGTTDIDPLSGESGLDHA
jgi:hypothetical protein